MYFLGKERLEAGTRWFAAMDGDVEHVQQQRAYFAAQVAARKCKNFVSVNPVLLWAREAHLDSNPSVLCQEPVDLGGGNCPSVTQEGSPSFQAQEEDGWMKADSPLGWGGTNRAV